MNEKSQNETVEWTSKHEGKLVATLMEPLTNPETKQRIGEKEQIIRINNASYDDLKFNLDMHVGQVATLKDDIQKLEKKLEEKGKKQPLSAEEQRILAAFEKLQKNKDIEQTEVQLKEKKRELQDKEYFITMREKTLASRPTE